MDFLNSIIGQINTVLWSYVLIALLILSGLFYTLRTGFAQGRLLGDMVALITGKLSSLRDGEKKVAGQVTGFQAFCIAVASHVGTGNLAGVAIAVVIGGPGALFWMWIIALLGGATSLIENTLAQTYKVKEGNGFRGGPSYYMEKALGQKTLGYIFSVIVIVTFAFIFNTVQANTIAQAFESSFTILKSATAGNSIGAYSFEVPSILIAPVATTKSPASTSNSIPPQVPTLINVSAPILCNSSTAIDVLAPPIPVLVTETFSPSKNPVYVTYSLLSATKTASSKYFAINLHLFGSPGKITYLPTSPAFISI